MDEPMDPAVSDVFSPQQLAMMDNYRKSLVANIRGNIGRSISETAYAQGALRRPKEDEVDPAVRQRLLSDLASTEQMRMQSDANKLKYLSEVLRAEIKSATDISVANGRLDGKVADGLLTQMDRSGVLLDNALSNLDETLSVDEQALVRDVVNNFTTNTGANPTERMNKIIEFSGNLSPERRTIVFDAFQDELIAIDPSWANFSFGNVQGTINNVSPAMAGLLGASDAQQTQLNDLIVLGVTAADQQEEIVRTETENINNLQTDIENLGVGLRETPSLRQARDAFNAVAQGSTVRQAAPQTIQGQTQTAPAGQQVIPGQPAPVGQAGQVVDPTQPSFLQGATQSNAEALIQQELEALLDPQLPQHLMMKQALMGSPEFLQYMQNEGLEDPEFAIRALLRTRRAEKRQEGSTDRVTRDNRILEGRTTAPVQERIGAAVRNRIRNLGQANLGQQVGEAARTVAGRLRSDGDYIEDETTTGEIAAPRKRARERIRQAFQREDRPARETTPRSDQRDLPPPDYSSLETPEQAVEPTPQATQRREPGQERTGVASTLTQQTDPTRRTGAAGGGTRTPEVPFLGGSVGRPQAPTQRRQTGDIQTVRDNDQSEPDAIRAQREAEERRLRFLSAVRNRIGQPRNQSQ